MWMHLGCKFCQTSSWTKESATSGHRHEAGTHKWMFTFFIHVSKTWTPSWARLVQDFAYARSISIRLRFHPSFSSFVLITSLLFIDIGDLGLDYYTSGAPYHIATQAISHPGLWSSIYCERTRFTPYMHIIVVTHYSCYTLHANFTPLFPAITNFILRVKYYKDTLQDIPSEEYCVTNEVFLDPWPFTPYPWPLTLDPWPPLTTLDHTWPLTLDPRPLTLDPWPLIYVPTR